MPAAKIAISLDQGLFERVNQFAETLHVSRSRLFTMAIEEYLKQKENEMLLEQLNAAYDDFPDEKEQGLSQKMRNKQRTLVEKSEW